MSTSAAPETDPAAAAVHALAAALGGRPSPCQTAATPDLWFNTDTAPAAIALCAPCHATDECLAYGRAIDARAGVWGAVNLTKKR